MARAKTTRTERRFFVFMNDEERNQVTERKDNLNDTYNLKQATVLRRFLTDHLDDPKILAYMGLIDKNDVF